MFTICVIFLSKKRMGVFMKVGFVSKDTEMIKVFKTKINKMLPLDSLFYTTFHSIRTICTETLLNGNFVALFIDTDTKEDIISFVKKCNENCCALKIIFFGSDIENVYKYYEVDHLAFLNKNDYEPYIDHVIVKIIQHMQDFEKKYILVHWKNLVYVLENKDVLYVERDKRRTLVHTIYGDVYTTYQHLDEFIDNLGKTFLRVHFSYIVNTQFVREYYRNHLVLADDVFIPVSRKYGKTIHDYFSDEDEDDYQE